MALNSDHNPIFRKVILPWYDTDAVCVLTVVFMLAVFGFSIAGISVASEMPEAGKYAWVPCALLVLSVVGTVAISLRLFRRHAHKLKKELP